MPRPLTDQERDAFLRGSHVAVFSVASTDARPPLTVPVWYAYQDDGNVFFFTGTTGEPVRKTRLIEQAGVVSLVVQREELPYRYVAAECRLVRVDRPPSAEQLLRVVGRYLPEEQARGFVSDVLERATPHLAGFTLRPERWNTLDFA